MTFACAAAVAALLTAASPPPLPKVDFSVAELHVRPRLVSARLPQDWWALAPRRIDPETGSAEGSVVQVLRSEDSGHSWQPATELQAALGKALEAEGETLRTLDFLAWYSPDVGVAAGYIGARVLRTVDAGRTWKAVPLPEPLWVYSLERSGARTWVCGSSGRIYRSDDAGARWAELKASPFNGEDRCMSLSFLTPDSGWAAGMQGTLWKTEDGGETWAALTPPKQAPRVLFAGTPGLPPELRHVLRLTRSIGWVGGSDGLFRTDDGGKTWQPIGRQQESGRYVSTRPDGRQVVTSSAAGLPLAAWLPSFADAWIVGPDVIASPHPEGLQLEVTGKVTRAGPLLTRPRGTLTQLEGLAQRTPQSWLGWAGDQVAATQDGGRTWYRVGRLPRTPVRDIVFLADGRVFAELTGGGLLRSRDAGHRWEPTTDALEAYDFTVASGRRPGGGSESTQTHWETPFDCAVSSPRASVKVDFGIQGCFGGTQSSLVLELAPDGAALHGKRDVGDGPVEVKRQLTRAEGEALMRELVAASTRPEVPSDCQSTTGYSAVLEWSCPNGTPQRTRAEFTSYGCGQRMRVDLVGGATSTGGAQGPDTYERALGIHEVAERALETADPPLPPRRP
ncbi:MULTISPECIES: hypothetical protein [Myxococcaceae]|uniref:WD40/YVTN/BNR-like repeat-containing protein n=1 Tax=Myxococcaceae TaxID=31 RepID=UPI00188E73B6|nr:MULTISPECIES: hypothetical protein [Myxococcaceae]MBF5046413.1 hypothetical protein [Simulacricoccus sp. 17bor-14]